MTVPLPGLGLPQPAGERGVWERQLVAQGLLPVGVDEVGRGCLAGPVYAAAAVLDFARLWRLDSKTRGLLRDSKRLSAKQRATILPLIREICQAQAIARAEVEEIDHLGIVPATFLAMRRALAGIPAGLHQILLIDGKAPLADYVGRQQAIVGGDDLCHSIACASILAKEARDAFMREQDQVFPGYGFADHVGYGTAKHLAMMGRHGVCSLHRRHFAPVRALLGG